MKVKLVRSKMKKMIEDTGKYKTVNISRGMYKQLLAEKLIEEAHELAEAMLEGDINSIMEESGDLSSVMNAIMKTFSIDYYKVIEIEGDKQEERGNFISNLGMILED